MDSTEKFDTTAQHTLVTTDRIEDKRVNLTHEQSMHMMSKFPCQKMKYCVNLSGLSAEETDGLKDNGIGDNKHTRQVFNTAEKFFAILMHSNDPDVLNTQCNSKR